MTSNIPRLGVLFLGRKRPGFDPQWGARMERAVRETLEKSAFSCFVPEPKANDDASLRRALADCRRERCEVLVVLQTTMSDGRLSPILAQGWDAPLVLWATPEEPAGAMISSCSLVGTHVFAATLRQLQRPFELLYGDPGDARTGRALEEAVSVAVAVQRLHNGKVGLVGQHAPGFIDLHADPFQLNRELGVQLHHFGLQEYLDAVPQMPEDAVGDDVARVREMGLPMEDVTEDDLPLQSRFYLAMRHMMEEQSLDALALRCWPEIPNIFGQWPYLAMVRLSSEGYPIALEGDVDGALSCWMGEALGLGRGYLSDWLEHSAKTITLWHPGNAPLSLCEPVGSARGPRLARHFNDRKPLVVNADLAADQPVTLFRLWRCDNRYHLMAEEAQTLVPRRNLMGTNGLVEVAGRDVEAWFDDLCHAGMPHHLAVFGGHHGHVLRRFARAMNINWVT